VVTAQAEAGGRQCSRTGGNQEVSDPGPRQAAPEGPLQWQKWRILPNEVQQAVRKQAWWQRWWYKAMQRGAPGRR